MYKYHKKSHLKSASAS